MSCCGSRDGETFFIYLLLSVSEIAGSGMPFPEPAFLVSNPETSSGRFSFCSRANFAYYKAIFSGVRHRI
jgi:hypothetical protein